MIAAVEKYLRGAMALAILGANAALILPASAPAATVDVTEELPDYDHHSRLSFAAAPGENNRLTFAITGEKDAYYTVEVRDQGAPLIAGGGCSGGGNPGWPAFCQLHEPVSHDICAKGCPIPAAGENWRVSIVVDLDDGENGLFASRLEPKVPIPMLVSSGPGNDQIDTAAGDDSLDPGAGADVVRTGLGSDRVEATGTPDESDLYDLGESRRGLRDFDELSYGDRVAPVVVWSGRGGTAEEGDELLGVETLIGGSGGDVLAGDGGIRRLEGGPGADVLVGGKQKSRIFGGEGSDLLVGGPQQDELREAEQDSSGDDIARGMGGGDLIVLGGGEDRAFAGRGNDRVRGGPGHDALGCGPGASDIVILPDRDALRNCELSILDLY